MAYLPGVPDVGPAPVSPTPHMNNAGVGRSGGTAIGHLARSVGKPGHTEHLGSVVGRRGAGMSTGTGGNPGMHSLGHYGKAPPLLGGAQIEGGVDPTAHPGAKVIRGGSGAMRSHIMVGGLGPGKGSTPGPVDNTYGSMDSE